MNVSVPSYVKISIISFGLMCYAHSSHSCTCSNTPASFCAASDTSEIIIQGVVIGEPKDYFVEIKILENIHKEINADTIHVLGQDGLNCGQDLDIFRMLIR